MIMPKAFLLYSFYRMVIIPDFSRNPDSQIRLVEPSLKEEVKSSYEDIQ